MAAISVGLLKVVWVCFCWPLFSRSAVHWYSSKKEHLYWGNEEKVLCRGGGDPFTFHKYSTGIRKLRGKIMGNNCSLILNQLCLCHSLNCFLGVYLRNVLEEFQPHMRRDQASKNI